MERQICKECFMLGFHKMGCSQRYSIMEINMYNWLKKSSKSKFEPEKESSKARVEKSPKNISEPIFAIARSFKEHPSRWKVEKKEEGESYFEKKIFDIKTKEKFSTKFCRYSQFQKVKDEPWYIPRTETILKRKIDCDWITEDESDYLIEEFDKMMTVKTTRLESIKQIRKNKERQRLMDIYK